MNDKLLEEIKDEVFKYYNQSKEKKSLNQNIDDTLESISKVTGLSIEEIKPIADDVHSNYITNKNKKRNKLILLFSSFILVVILISSFFYFSKKSPVKIVSATTYITDKITGKNKPNKVIETVNIDQTIYGYVKWDFEKNKNEYQSQLKITDSKGRVARVCMHDTKQQSYSMVWSCSYKFKKGLDSVGTWKFEAFIDGKKTSETFFTVKNI
ncbi:hypothetical protein [Pseudocolwellia agarivorans]|uniref:hypothetical protein n=1 Tax=Pseudocolwellia agarivorans TaxID=1911682 RepID=UPI0009861299|nr:hypothetical protein [Pseudocolwellia agarivorans]